MPLLSATSAIEPALERLKSMLFRPFRFTTWLKIGFIGWLAGAAGSSGSFNIPSGSHGDGGDVAHDVGRAISSWMHEHVLLILLIIAFLTMVGLIFLYISCRFRFILFDSVLRRDAQIGRGWRLYGPQAQRYFGFQLAFLLSILALALLVVGLPLWRAYTRGAFQSGDPFMWLRVLIPVVLALIAVVIISTIVNSFANDFGIPILALDNSTLGSAWQTFKQIVSTEPWSFAGYLGMKLVLWIAAGIAVVIPFVIIVLVLLIPGVILVLVGVAVAKALGPIAAVLLAVVGALLAVAVFFILGMLAIAPVAVFFTSYSLYFLGGRYPRLGALLWPEPPSSPTAPLPLVPPPPPPEMGSIG